jgi:hypothetical protein
MRSARPLSGTVLGRVPGLLQNHNIRSDLILRPVRHVACLHHLVQVLRFPFEELFAQLIERTAPLRPRMTRQAA